MPTFSIPTDWIEKIRSQAERDYPNETCGMLIGPEHRKDQITKIRPCRNVQDHYHAQDPASFPRTARTAYFIDPRELLTLQKEIREKQEKIRIIYHSHCDAGAYFSEEDKRVALADGQPCYPGVEYLVVSVLKGKTAGMALFCWNPDKEDFEAKEN